MQGKKLVIAAIGLIAIIGGWYAFRPERLFINQKVNESLETGSTASAAVQPTSDAMSSEPKMLVAGTFHSGSHETAGAVTIYQLANGSRTLRLTNFHTSNGPDVHVYLIAAKDAMDNATVTTSGFVDLASLKGNVGDQNYELPADLDLAKYGAVTIWCKRFGVNFGTAPLKPANS